jgi:hypothetical protein
LLDVTQTRKRFLWREVKNRSESTVWKQYRRRAAKYAAAAESWMAGEGVHQSESTRALWKEYTECEVCAGVQSQGY